MSNIASTRKNEGILETHGGHGDTKIEFGKCNFTWSIAQYSNLLRRRDILQSSKFSAIGDDFLWYLQLYYQPVTLNGDPDQDFVVISLHRGNDHLEKYCPISGDMEISVLKPDRTEIGNKTTSFELGTSCIGVPCFQFFYRFRPCSFARICEIKKWLCQDELRILCKLNYSKKPDVISCYTPWNSNPAKIFEHSLSRDFEQILNEGYFSDVTISVKAKNYAVHKAILSARSSVFKSMFRSNMQETQNNNIVIKDIEQEIVEEMLRYVYTGKPKNLEESAYELLPVADKYDLTELRMMCEEVLLTKLSSDNVDKVLLLADMHHAEKLKAHTLRFIKMKYTSCKEFKNTEAWNMITKSRAHLMKDMLDVFFDE